MLTRLVSGKNSLTLVLAICTISYSMYSKANDDIANVKDTPSAIVLDIDLLGDTSVESMQARDAQLIKTFSKILRQKLKDLAVIDVLDDSHTLAIVDSAAESQFLQRCNGCELEVARALGAKLVVVPWVFRMSKLIQTMYIEVRDVETGHIVLHQGRNYRGNTEEGWQHVIDHLVDVTNVELQKSM